MNPQEKLYSEIYSKVAESLGLPYTVVENTYKAFWLFVRTKVTELPLKDDLTEEDFKQLRTSVNIPSLGKFSCTYDRYKRVKKRFEYIKFIKDNAEH